MTVGVLFFLTEKVELKFCNKNTHLQALNHKKSNELGNILSKYICFPVTYWLFVMKILRNLALPIQFNFFRTCFILTKPKIFFIALSQYSRFAIRPWILFMLQCFGLVIISYKVHCNYMKQVILTFHFVINMLFYSK